MTTHEQTQPCTCGVVDRCATDTRYPVEYNAQTASYQLKSWDRRCAHVMRYCFFCGGALPERSEELFSVPEEGEKEQVLALLRGMKNVEDVVRVLGMADRTWSLELFTTVHGTGPRRQVRQLYYGSKWKSLDLHVAEFEDGSVQFAVSGKYICRASRAGGSN